MNRLQPDADDSRFIRRVLIVLLTVAVAYALFKAVNLLILLFGAILGAVTIHAVAELYERRLRLSGRVSVPAAMLTAIAGIGFLIWLFGVQFGAQVNAFVIQLPDILQRVDALISRSPVGAKVADAVEAAYAGSRVAQDIGGLATGGAELVLNVLLLVVGALFLAASPGVYQRGLLLLVPRAYRAAGEDALADTTVSLRLWLRAQLIGMTTMGLMVGLGLWAAGVPSAAALGLLAGLSEFIPYVGPTAAMVPALGLAATGGSDTLAWALVVFVAIRIVHTNLITPLLQRHVVHVPPAVTLFAILGIGTVFGLFGLFFSGALLVVIFTLVRSLYLREVLGEDVAPPVHPHIPPHDSTQAERCTKDSLPAARRLGTH